MHKKTVFILLLSTTIFVSWKSKKKVDCPTFDIEEDLKKEEKKEKSKYRVIILKDGKKIFNRKKSKRKKKEKIF